MYQNDSKFSLKSSTQHSYRAKHKRCQKCNVSVESGLTPKQLIWVCRQLLDVIWDVRAARLMWGMGSVTSGLWVLITLRLWRACHKSRESDTWWEVSEMILACNLHLLKIDPWNKGFLCMLPWKKELMHASQFCSIPEGTSQLSCTCKRLLDC